MCDGPRAYYTPSGLRLNLDRSPYDSYGEKSITKSYKELPFLETRGFSPNLCSLIVIFNGCLAKSGRDEGKTTKLYLNLKQYL